MCGSLKLQVSVCSNVEDEKLRVSARKTDGTRTLLDCSLLRFVADEVLKLQLVFVWQFLDVWDGDGRAREGIHDKFNGIQKGI